MDTQKFIKAHCLDMDITELKYRVSKFSEMLNSEKRYTLDISSGKTLIYLDEDESRNITKLLLDIWKEKLERKTRQFEEL